MHRSARLICATLALAAGGSPSVVAQTRDRAALYEERCAVCHGTQGEGGQGPTLQGVVGRAAGSTRFGYSQALRNAGFSWTAERLDSYLTDPAAAVPGTTMVIGPRTRRRGRRSSAISRRCVPGPRHRPRRPRLRRPRPRRWGGY